MFKYVVSLVLLMGSVSAFGADALKDSVSDLAASFADLARLLPKKAGGGGGDKEPAKRTFSSLKDRAIRKLALVAKTEQKERSFSSRAAVLAFLDENDANPLNADDVAMASQHDKDEFEHAVQSMFKGGAAEKAFAFEAELPKLLAPIEADIRKAIRGGKTYDSIEAIRAQFGPRIEQALPPVLSSLQSITEVNDHLRKYVDATPELLRPVMRGDVEEQINLAVRYMLEIDPGKTLYRTKEDRYNFLASELPEVRMLGSDGIKRLNDELQSIGSY